MKKSIYTFTFLSLLSLVCFAGTEDEISLEGSMVCNSFQEYEGEGGLNDILGNGPLAIAPLKGHKRMPEDANPLNFSTSDMSAFPDEEYERAMYRFLRQKASERGETIQTRTSAQELQEELYKKHLTTELVQKFFGNVDDFSQITKEDFQKVDIFLHQIRLAMLEIVKPEGFEEDPFSSESDEEVSSRPQSPSSATSTTSSEQTSPKSAKKEKKRKKKSKKTNTFKVHRNVEQPRLNITTLQFEPETAASRARAFWRAKDQEASNKQQKKSKIPLKRADSRDLSTCKRLSKED